jgi:heat shock protein HslJ
VGSILALLILAAAALGLAGCALLPSPWVGRWELVSVDGNPRAAPASIVLTDTAIEIETGCNTGAGTYHLDGERLTLTDVAFTAVGCSDALGRQDAAFLALASGSPTLRIADDRMTLDAGSGIPVLVFSRTSGA